MGRIEPDRWAKFDQLITDGFSTAEASRRVHIHYNTAMARTKKTGQARKANPLGLCPEAQRALTDFGYFRARYMGRISTPWQEEAGYRMADLLASPDREYVVVNVCPGSGKSTLFTHDIPSWLAVKDRALRCMIGSATANIAKNYTRRLRATFDREHLLPANADELLAGRALDPTGLLAKDYGNFRPANRDMWRVDEFILAQPGGFTVEDKEPSFVSYGRDSGFLGGRFDLVIWDDLVTRRTMRTADARAEMIRWYEDEAETRVEPGGLFLLQGQRLDSNDLYRHALDLRGADWTELEDDTDAPRKYTHIVYKAHDETKCTGTHHDCTRTCTQPCPLIDKAWPKGCLLDPHRLPFKFLKPLMRDKAENFAVVYQQEEHNPASVLVNPLWVKGGLDPETGEKYLGCWDTSRSLGQWPQGLAGQVQSIACVDPSGEQYWGATHWACQESTDTDHLIQLSRSHMMAGHLLDQLQDGTFVGLMEDWQRNSVEMGHPITHWIVEINAAQRYLLQYRHVQDWQRSRRVMLIPHATHRNRSDPERGVQTLGNLWRHGQVQLPAADDHSRLTSHKLVTEATHYPNGPSTDLLMSQWFLRFNLPNLRRKNHTQPPAARPAWLNGGVHLDQPRHLYTVSRTG